MLSLAKKTEAISLQLETNHGEGVTKENLHLFDRIDHEIDEINFEHAAKLCKAANFNISWVRKIRHSIKETYNVPLKQLLLNSLGIFDKGSPSQRDMSGFLSYIQMSQFLKTLNFHSLQLRNDEIEFTLFQFVYLKLHMYQLRLDQDVAEQSEQLK